MPSANSFSSVKPSLSSSRSALSPTPSSSLSATSPLSRGARYELTLSAVERNPSVRRNALKHYGLKCYACDLVPKTANQIDIHHLDPVAEGERQTTLYDLVPLCANCHRLAHSERPPLSVDAIRALALSNSLRSETQEPPQRLPYSF